MSQIRVDPAELEKLVNGISQGEAQLRNMIGQTHQDMGNLATAWKGAAAQTYMNKMQYCVERYQTVVNSLVALRNALNDAKDRLVQAEIAAQQSAGQQ